MLDRDRDAAPPPLDDELADRATILGMVVRNALEGRLHGGELGDLSLTDEQMALLNPIVRNAIATGLHAFAHYNSERPARRFVNFQARLVPNYWERPELLDDYVALWPFFATRPEDELRCRYCGRIVVARSSSGNNRWIHLAADGGRNVGCRAASFTVENGWDDNLDRSWKARPDR
jgi:hypothetical protein